MFTSKWCLKSVPLSTTKYNEKKKSKLSQQIFVKLSIIKQKSDHATETCHGAVLTVIDDDSGQNRILLNDSHSVRRHLHISCQGHRRYSYIICLKSVKLYP